MSDKDYTQVPHIGAITELGAGAYRLAVDTDGGLILQGAFKWTTGNTGGVEWRKIPTVVLTEKSP